MPEDLRTFIESAKTAGASDSFLATLLEEFGWPKKEIWLAFGDYYARLTGMPVPRRPTGVESAKDAFFYLLAFSTLATWTWALGSMMFTFINKWFPDGVYNIAVWNGDYNVASEMASIFVAFPLYMLVMRMIVRAADEQPEKLDSGVRKWLTYIALLIAAGCLIGDLITFLNFLLRGEVTARFFWKVMVVLAISGGVFGYYLRSLRAYDAIRNRVYGSAAATCAIAAIAIGFLHLGPPSNQRALAADNRREYDLRNIASILRSRKQLPATLSEAGITSRDPESKVPYEFRVLSQNGYELCATFALGFEENNDVFWSHPAGRHCYSLNTASNP